MEVPFLGTYNVLSQESLMTVESNISLVYVQSCKLVSARSFFPDPGRRVHWILMHAVTGKSFILLKMTLTAISSYVVCS